MLKKKMEVGSLYLGVFLITFIIAVILRVMKVNYSIGFITNFIIAIYIFLDLILEKKKTMNVYRLLLVMFLFLNILEGFGRMFDTDYINSFGSNYVISNWVCLIGEFIISLYIACKLFVRKNFINSNILYFAVSCIGVMMSVVWFVVVLMAGNFLIMNVIVGFLLLSMRLLFVRYVYLDK